MLNSNNIQEKGLEFQAKAFLSTLPFLTNLHGLKCEIFLPQIYQGNYDDDGKVTYLTIPSLTKKLIVFNYFQLNQYGRGLFDTFHDNDSRIVITTLEQKLTKNSKIKAYQGRSYTEYRVDNFKNFTGVNIEEYVDREIILVQNILIPFV